MNIGPPLLASCDRCGHPCDTELLHDDGIGWIGPCCRVVRTPRRIQLRRTAGWRKSPGTISVARPSKWGNPYVVGSDIPGAGGDVYDRAGAVEMFRRSAMTFWGEDFRAVVRAELRGHDLACWCPLDQPCHADVLLKLANGGGV